MSILGSLFGKNVKKDDSVAELFKKPSKAVTNEQLRSSRTEVAVPEDAKGQEREESDLEESDSEESDSGESDSDDKVSHKKRSEEEDLEEPTKKKRKRDQDDNLEDEYFNRLLKEDKEDEEENGKGEESEESEGSAKEQANGKSEEVETKSARAKSVDVKEEELKKAEKTVFVGNVLSEVITSKKTYKKFKELFSDIGKVDSIRFRSISFEEILPRKVAFAKKKLLKSRDSVNAYVVFKEKEPSLKAVEELNATVFDDHHLRVDHVAHPAPKDNKRTIFVGNLDFEEKEETLWRHFNEHCSNDVELVRVVRDSATNLGKGFALVQFKDTLSVNKALLLNNKPVSKTSKRKLRITRATSKAKPSTISPNHIDNQKKNPRKKSHLSDKQRTKLGRAQKVLGKADRATAGKSMEGERAVKGDTVAGFGKKKIRSKKKNKITKRSTSFKNRKANV